MIISGSALYSLGNSGGATTTKKPTLKDMTAPKIIKTDMDGKIVQDQPLVYTDGTPVVNVNTNKPVNSTTTSYVQDNPLISANKGADTQVNGSSAINSLAGVNKPAEAVTVAPKSTVSNFQNTIVDANGNVLSQGSGGTKEDAAASLATSQAAYANTPAGIAAAKATEKLKLANMPGYDANGDPLTTPVTPPNPDNTDDYVSTEDLTVENPVDYNKTYTSGAYRSAIDALAGQAQGRPSAGLLAGESQGREALAAATKQAEAKAGATAQAQGALGQGNAVSLAQQTRQSALGALAGQTMDFAKLRGDEQQAAIDKIISAEQAERGDVINAERVNLEKSGQLLDLNQLNSQTSNWKGDLALARDKFIQDGRQFSINELNNMERFDKELGFNKEKWNAEFGEEKSANHMRALLELSVDNPVLARKLQSFMLAGGKGAVGQFSPAEITEMEKLKADAANKENKALDLMFQQAELLGLQITKEKLTAGEELAGITNYKTNVKSAISSKDVTKIKPDDWEKITDNDEKDIISNGLVKNVAKDYSVTDSSSENSMYKQFEAGKLKNGDVVEKDGKLYKLVRSDRRRAGDADGWDTGEDSYNHRRTIIGVPVRGGDEVEVWSSDKY